MELIFNELSIYPISDNEYNANNKMTIFSSTVATAKKKGFRYIRSYYDTNLVILAENYTIYNWFNNKSVQKNEKDILYGMIIKPFIKDEDDNIQKQYINANYYFENIEYSINMTECVGLASAYLYETLSISLSSSPLWDSPTLKLLIEKEGVFSTADILNISSEKSFENNNISIFIENIGVLNLIKTELNFTDKDIHLADHHGKAELQILCNKLILNPYVIKMRSTDWGGSNFIRKVFQDGVVEIVLINSQRKYALWVQTTGRNLKETKAIAKMLKEKYS